MSYECVTIEAMIASPSDVATERRIATEVIQEWNAVNSSKMKVVIMPLTWETHSVPSMGTPPQKVINKMVLERADLLIGIFWTRIGTPTEDSESGSIEEIEKHVGSGKPAMLYFSDQPVVPDSINPEQYKRLSIFKERCMKEGLVEIYSDLTDFKTKLTRQLALKVNQDEYLQKLITINSRTDDSHATIAIVETQSDAISRLSNEAKLLLVEAAQDSTGNIYKMRYIGGAEIQTNGRNFITDSNPRTLALWSSAIDELVDNELIEGRGTKGEIFAVTNKGYQVADELRDSL